MDKGKDKVEKDIVDNIIWMLIIAGVICFIYFIFSEEYTNLVNTEDNITNILDDDFNKILYPHYPHMPLKYKVNNIGCSDISINQITKGFGILENITENTISFVESMEDSDLTLNCVSRDYLFGERSRILKPYIICEEIRLKEVPPTINWGNDGYFDSEIYRYQTSSLISKNKTISIFELCYVNRSLYNKVSKELLGDFNFDEDVLGEGGPSLVENNIILKGEINLYVGFEETSVCIFPGTEIHEILHSFAFGHSFVSYFENEYQRDLVSGYFSNLEATKDIMFPHHWCKYRTEVNEKYASCLKYIYSNGVYGRSCSEINFLDIK